MNLTVHVAASVGWLGAVAGFLALSIAGLTSDDRRTVESAYVAMNATGWFVLVPLSVASLISGLVQGAGTKWGILRHYWVVVKLCMNVLATAVLLMYMQTLDRLAGIARTLTAGSPLGEVRSASPVLHAAGALALLLVATVLSVFKPRGMTRRGFRHERFAAAGSDRIPLGS